MPSDLGPKTDGEVDGSGLVIDCQWEKKHDTQNITRGIIENDKDIHIMTGSASKRFPTAVAGS